MDQFPLEEIVNKVGSRFAVVVAAAQRAKQIKDGSPPLVQVNSRNPLTIALAEIAAGKVLIGEPEPSAVEEPRITRDQYFVGRQDLQEDRLPLRRASARAAQAARQDADDFDEDEEEDLEEDEDDLLDDEE